MGRLTGELTLPVDGPASKAIKKNDWSFVAGWLSGRFGVSLTSDWVCMNIPRNRHGKIFTDGWSDGSWAMWFKNRIMEDRLLEPPSNPKTFYERMGCELHTGFLSVYESPEHLARLENDTTPVRRGPDTPGIERREAPKGAIDAVSNRVLPGSHQ